MLVPGRDHIGVGVGAMVSARDYRFFLTRRGPAARNEIGTWEFPGGALEFGERLEDGIRREFREEYGMRIEVFDRLGVFDHILPAETQHWISITFLARHVAGTPTILEPTMCAEIGWFPLDALPSPLSRITEANVEKYRSHHARGTDFRQWVEGGGRVER